MKLALGIPTLEMFPPRNLQSVFRITKEMTKVGEPALLQTIKQVPYDRAREKIITAALENEQDYLFFLDADNIIPDNGFTRLFETMQEKKAPVVVGYYVQRGYPYASLWGKEIETGEEVSLRHVDPKNPVERVDTCGLGCALISLNWVRNFLSPPYFKIEPCKDSPGGVIYEDTYFFRKVHRAGGRCYGRSDVICGHLDEINITPEIATELRRAFLIQNGLTIPQELLLEKESSFVPDANGRLREGLEPSSGEGGES